MAQTYHLGGITNTKLTFDDGKMHIEEHQDAEPILHYTHAMRNHRFSASACDGMLRHVAEVPAVDFYRWCREANVEPGSLDADLMLERKLADPANAKLLAAPSLRDPHIIIKGAR